MYEQYKEEFTKYLKPRGMIGLILLGILMILFAFVMILAEIPILMFFLFLAVGLMLLVLALRSLIDYPAYIRSLEQSGYMAQILQDYAQANSAMKNRLRFGNFYLYAKGQGKVLAYQDLVRVYQYIHRTNFVEDRRELKYVNREGKEGTLCKLKLRGKSDEELRMVIAMLYRKNPSLQVGYHK